MCRRRRRAPRRHVPPICRPCWRCRASAATRRGRSSLLPSTWRHAGRHEHRARARPPDRAQPSRTGGAADGRRPPRRRRVGRSPDVTGRRDGSTCLHGFWGRRSAGRSSPGAPSARCAQVARGGGSASLYGTMPRRIPPWARHECLARRLDSLDQTGKEGDGSSARPGRGRWLPPTSRTWPAGHTIKLALRERLPASSMTGCSPSTRLATGSLDPLTLGRSWLLGVSGRLDGLDDVVAECCSGADQLPSDGGSGTEVP